MTASRVRPNATTRRRLIKVLAADDAALEYLYYLDDDQTAAIFSAFGTFDCR